MLTLIGSGEEVGEFVGARTGGQDAPEGARRKHHDAGRTFHVGEKQNNLDSVESGVRRVDCLRCQEMEAGQGGGRDERLDRMESQLQTVHELVLLMKEKMWRESDEVRGEQADGHTARDTFGQGRESGHRQGGGGGGWGAVQAAGVEAQAGTGWEGEKKQGRGEGGDEPGLTSSVDVIMDTKMREQFVTMLGHLRSLDMRVASIGAPDKEWWREGGKEGWWEQRVN